MKRKIERYTHPLITEVDTSETGSGYFCEEIAEMLGVLNKTNDNPNKKLIKKIAEFLDLNPSGYRESEVYNSSNGGIGYHLHQKPKYSVEQIELIKRVIQACDVSPKGYCKFEGVTFRKR
jgi:hypothetical protein